MERKNGDWTIKSTEKKFGNGFFSVFEDQVVRPDGKDDRYATVHFKPGAAVLPIDDEGNVYLTRQFRYALGRKDLEAVAGAIDVETPLEAAEREAKEELGIEAKEWIDLGEIESNTSVTRSSSHLFIARELKFGKPHTEATEDIEPVKMRFSEALEKVLSGEITHGETCELVLRAYFRK
jgi:ADP-ribose pyrophosphatase